MIRNCYRIRLNWKGNRNISNDMLLSLSLNHNNSSETLQGLVGNLQKNGLIQNELVYQSMISVDRADFVPNTSNAYTDEPVRVNGFEELSEIPDSIVVSSPHMHAIALEKLAPSSGLGVGLDLGCGTGVMSSYMRKIFPTVIGVDTFPKLLCKARDIVSARGDEESIRFIQADMDNGEGVLDLLGLDEISVGGVHFGFCVEKVPEHLISLMKPSARMIVPLGVPGCEQELVLVEKRTDGSYEMERVMTCLYSLSNKYLEETCKKKEIILDIEKELERLTKLVQIWRVEYSESKGKSPSIDDMNRDKYCSELMKELAHIRKLERIQQSKQ